MWVIPHVCSDRLTSVGLNNFLQLDTVDTLVYYHSDHVTVPDTSFVVLCGEDHHTLMLCSSDVHVVGRKEYGRLGLGKDQVPKCFVQLSTGGFQVKSIAADESVSSAVTEDGFICLRYGIQSTT